MIQCSVCILFLQAEAHSLYAGCHRERSPADPRQAAQHPGSAGLPKQSTRLGHRPGGDPGQNMINTRCQKHDS